MKQYILKTQNIAFPHRTTMDKKKVVLAYSGGLDTSFCCIYLTRDLGYEVHSVIVNTGGFSDEELKTVEKRAYEMGVTSHHVVDETKNFYDTCDKFSWNRSLRRTLVRHSF